MLENIVSNVLFALLSFFVLLLFLFTRLLLLLFLENVLELFLVLLHLTNFDCVAVTVLAFIIMRSYVDVKVWRAIFIV